MQETRRVSREEGKIESSIEYILELLEDIADVPSSLREQIEAQTDLDILKQWRKLAAKCEIIEEFQEKAELYKDCCHFVKKDKKLRK